MKIAAPDQVNGGAVDRFTFVHFGVGVAYGLAGVSLPTAATLAVAWEIVEIPLKEQLPRVFPNATQDRLANAIGDVLAVLGGYFAGRFIRGR